MPETAALNQINRKLETLSLEELMAVRVKTNELIGQKLKLEPVPQAADKDGSLERAIALVDEWMNEESVYDEQTYPQIEARLHRNRLSL